jgi:hypothetical protein
MGNFLNGLFGQDHIPPPALVATLTLLALFAAVSIADFYVFVTQGKHWPNYGVFATIAGGGGGGGPYAMHAVNSYLNAPRGSWPTPPNQTGGGKSQNDNLRG